MYLFATANWTARQLMRSPWFWTWGTVSLLAWPIVATLTPLGLVSESGSDGRALYEIAFLGGLIGCLQGITCAEDVRWIATTHPLARRLGLLLAILATATFLTAALSLLPALATGHSALVATAPLELVSALAHLCVLAVGLTLAPLPAATRLVSLPLLVWIIPALLSGGGPLAAWSTHALDAHAPLAALETETVSKGSDWKALLAPIIGWLGVLVLGARTPRLLHALRDPR